MKSNSKIAAAWLACISAFVALSAMLMFPSAGAAKVGVVAATANPTAPRFDQIAVLLSDNKVLVAGGMRANYAIESSAELYDPVARRFLPVAAMHSPRVGAVSALLPNGNALIAGGWDGSATKCQATAEIYDASRRVFRPAGSMSIPRCGAIAFGLRNGKVLVVGGSLDPDHGPQASAELYDPRTGTFLPTGSMHVPRSAFAGVTLSDGRILVIGGTSAGPYPRRTIETSAETYDPATGRFTTTGRMALPRYKMGAVRLVNNRVLVVGGSDNRDWDGTMNSTEIFDPVSGKFTRGPDMHFKRFKLAGGVVALSDGRVLVSGGAERAEIYDPATNAFTSAGGGALDGFYYSTSTQLANRDVLIVGGYGHDPGAGAVAHAWLYRP